MLRFEPTLQVFRIPSPLVEKDKRDYCFLDHLVLPEEEEGIG